MLPTVPLLTRHARLASLLDAFPPFRSRKGGTRRSGAHAARYVRCASTPISWDFDEFPPLRQTVPFSLKMRRERAIERKKRKKAEMARQRERRLSSRRARTLPRYVALPRVL